MNGHGATISDCSAELVDLASQLVQLSITASLDPNPNWGLAWQASWLAAAREPIQGPVDPALCPSRLAAWKEIKLRLNTTRQETVSSKLLPRPSKAPPATKLCAGYATSHRIH